MNTILVTLMVTLPGWANDMDVRPKKAKTLVYTAGEGPSDAIAMPRKISSLMVEGPGTLELEFFGVVIKRGRKTQGPGEVSVLRGGETFTTIAFGENTLDARIRRRKAWRLTAPQKVSVDLEDGPNVFVFKPSRASRGGFALRASFTPPVAAPDEPVDPPPSPTPPPAVEEPPLIGRGFEPEIVSEVAAEAVETVEPGFDLLGERPPSRTIRGEDESALYLLVTAGQSLKMEARGTGVLVFDFHAHRQPSLPATMEPAVLAVLLDDVLVETLKVDGPIDEGYTTDGQDYRLSERAQFQVTIPPGKHNIEVTLSDNALAGGSVKVRFETADVTTVASDALPTAPDAPPLIEIRDEPERELPSNWVGFTVAGGATLSNSSAQVGAMGLADAFLMPGDFGRIFGFGLTSGYAFVQTDETVGDRRSPDSPTAVRLTEQVVPALLDLRLAFDLDGVVFMLGAGGGGMIALAETEALGSSTSTDAQWVWGVTGHASLMVRAGDGYFTLRGQWIGSEPRDIENLRDYDPGLALLSFGYVFSNR